VKIHFIGIGGIGVSSLAQYYLAEGHQISGSDLVSSEITDFLNKKGIKIIIGNLAENISKDIDLVIHSPAVKSDNQEFKRAKELNVKTQSYPEALGDLTKKYYTIAVSGAHGKSTTASMIGLLLIKARLDPTIIVGTKLKELSDPILSNGEGTNFRIGKSKYLVIEACEYDSSFLNYNPNIIVVTNIDKEHMDYFKNFSNVLRTFQKFTLKIILDGFLVINSNDKNTSLIRANKKWLKELQNKKIKVNEFSLKQKEVVLLKKILKIPGKHNISNALAALSVARILGVPDKISFKSLSEYRGSWRRFEIIKTKPYTLISDYGHHPNEILATLESVREKYPKKKIWCIFQPHQYQRTYYLFNDFISLFKKVKIDNIIITDIYDVAGREVKKINNSVDSELLVKKINNPPSRKASEGQGKNVKYMSKENAEKFVKENIKNGDVLIIMGAGDIYKITDRF